MPQYRISSGDMDYIHETPFEAAAIALAIVAVETCKPRKPGDIIEISGGQYTGDDVTYVSFASVATQLGRMTKG